jgi:hypothetical protein
VALTTNNRTVYKLHSIQPWMIKVCHWFIKYKWLSQDNLISFTKNNKNPKRPVTISNYWQQPINLVLIFIHLYKNKLLFLIFTFMFIHLYKNKLLFLIFTFMFIHMYRDELLFLIFTFMFIHMYRNELLFLIFYLYVHTPVQKWTLVLIFNFMFIHLYRNELLS